jgi:hypothetical protein
LISAAKTSSIVCTPVSDSARLLQRLLAIRSWVLLHRRNARGRMTSPAPGPAIRRNRRVLRDRDGHPAVGEPTRGRLEPGTVLLELHAERAMLRPEHEHDLVPSTSIRWAWATTVP